MNEEFKVTLPKLGESIVGATIVQWFKKVGERVQLDEPLLEVSTDKVNSEIPSPAAGILKEIHAPSEEEISVGALLATITVEGAGQAPAERQEKKKIESSSGSDQRDFFSPALLRLASEKGMRLEELERIPRSGSGGRLTKGDLEEYLEKRHSPPRAAPDALKIVVPRSEEGGEVERVKMSHMRKAIADNMVRSFYEAPHASLIHEVDVTALLKLIHKEKEELLAKQGVKLTITTFIVRAISRALQEYPLLNSSLEGDTIVMKRFVNVGIAVSVDQGVLVPVIKNCQRLNLISIAKAIADLSQRAREGKLAPGDISEGTITLTNFGMTGVQIGIPIIRYPEVAIVGIGAIHKKVVPADEGDLLAVRSMVHISLTFDHRVLDGIYGCGFLGSLKKHLEEDLKL
jgi:2-oxoglutarate dehydrogenase E2 component (dihydrolipoamide succinyltransferase)